MTDSLLFKRFSRERIRLALAWIAACCAAGIFLWNSHEQAHGKAGQHLKETTTLVHNGLGIQLAEIHKAMTNLTIGLDIANLPHEQAAQHLATVARTKPNMLAFYLLDETGTVRAASHDTLHGQSHAQQEYFRLARDHAGNRQLLIEIETPDGSDENIMLLSQRLTTGDGRFNGLLTAAVKPEILLPWLQAIQDPQHVLVQLIHSTSMKQLLTGTSTRTLPHGLYTAESPLYRHLKSGQQFSTASWHPLAGDPCCVLAMQNLQLPGDDEPLPLMIVAAFTPEMLHNSWQQQAMWLVSTLLLGGLLLTSLLLLSQQRRRNQWQQQQALKEQRDIFTKRWETALDMTGQGVWEWDLRTREAYFSPHLKAMLGYPEDDPVDCLTDWPERVHPDDQQEVLQLLQDYLNGKTESYQSVHRQRSKSGDYIWVLDRGRAIEYDHLGKITKLLGVHINITESKQQEEKLARIAEHVPGVLYQFLLNPQGRFSFLYASANLEDIFGHSITELNENPDLLFGCIHPQDRQQVRDSLLESSRQLSPWQSDYRVELPHNGERWIKDQANPVRRADGSTLWNGYLQDVTASKQQSMRLEETEMLFRYLFNELPIGLAMVDEAGLFYLRNRAFQQLFTGEPGQQLTLEEWWVNSYPDPLYRDQVKRQWQFHIDQALVVDNLIPEQEYLVRMRDGTMRMISISGITFGKHFLAIFQDHSEYIEQANFLRNMAYRDSLTGLANRRKFDESLANEWRHCQRTGQPLTVLMIDIDHFKAYNDHYGHPAGDACLQKIAATLQQQVQRVHDLVARYGGEEFVCLLPGTNQPDACQLADKLVKSIHDLEIPHILAPVTGKVTISIGVATVVPDATLHRDQLLQQADANLYKAKQEGRNRFYCQATTTTG